MAQARAAIIVAGAEAAVVNVGAGTFNVAVEVVLDQPIALIGRGGVGAAESEQSIVRQTADLRVFTLSDAKVRLEGLVVENGYLTGSGAGQNGGNVYMTKGTVTNCVIRGNRYYAHSGSLWGGWGNRGGGVYMTGGEVVDCILTNNTVNGGNSGQAYETAFSQGGGAYLTGGTLRRTQIAYNKANVQKVVSSAPNAYGAGVYVSGAEAVVENCLVLQNRMTGITTAYYGAGVYVGNGTLQQCTVVTNGTPGDGVTTGGGVMQAGGSVRNCIVWDNAAANYPDYSGSGGSVTYSCAPELTTGLGNITDAPAFVNAATNNFRLQYGSPCIDRGTNLSGIVTDDLDGRARPLDGNGSGTAEYDMGAYETPPDSAFRCSFTADDTRGYLSHQVVFTATVSGEGDHTNIQSYAWNFGGGGAAQAGPDKKVVTNMFGTGLYTIGLTVSNSLGEVTNLVRQNHILVIGDPVFVATNGANVPPYQNWSNAATSFQAGFDMAELGFVEGATSGAVVVGAGTFTVSAEVLLDKPIAVVGQGRGQTTVRQTALARVFKLDNVSARLEGMTVENGYLDKKQIGGNVLVLNGTVTNCAVRGNRYVTASGISQITGYGGGVGMSGGLVTDSMVFGNTVNLYCWGYAYTPVGYGGGIYMTGGTVRRTHVFGNSVFVQAENYGRPAYGGGVYVAGAGAIVENCLILSNRVYQQTAAHKANLAGGGLYLNAGTVRNCTIVANTNGLTTGTSLGGGVRQTGGTGVNCIVWGNAAAGDTNYSGTAQDATYSLAPELVAGVGNKTGDPLFKAPLSADYRLLPTSPCVNAGANQLDWMATAKDLDGNPRIQCGVVDMGAYEWVPPRGTLITVR